jgi:sortase A
MFPIGNQAEGELPRNAGSGGVSLFTDPRKARKRFDWMGFSLLAFAFAFLGYVGYVYVDRIAYQAAEAKRFDAMMAGAGAAKSDAARRFADGSIGRLTIETADISVLVGPASDDLSLRRGAGHIAGTAYPGDRGNVGIAGHRDDVFRDLRKVRYGDEIWLQTPDGTFKYRVKTLLTVTPERVDVLAPVGYESITLVTCFPFDFIGSAPLRYVVRARKVGGQSA